jgi:MinD-like ATPase involved in chromosome partitioning or flagellar assembly
MNERKDIERNEINNLLDLINKEINFEDLLCKFGPEGLYLIAGKLIEVADKDIIEAYERSVSNI